MDVAVFDQGVRAAVVHGGVVAPAEQGQVVHAGGSAVGPVGDVVGFGPRGGDRALGVCAPLVSYP